MNKMVVVTGATTGTGYCVAQKFAANGYDVCITSRDQARAQEAAARLKAENDGKIETFGYGLEVLDEPQMAAMFDDLKQKGHLVSTLVLVAANMGINMPNFLEVDFKDWIRVIDTNIGWNFMFCRQAAKHMLQLGGGAIVVIGSVNARFSPQPGCGAWPLPHPCQYGGGRRHQDGAVLCTPGDPELAAQQKPAGGYCGVPGHCKRSLLPGRQRAGPHHYRRRAGSGRRQPCTVRLRRGRHQAFGRYRDRGLTRNWNTDKGACI